MKRTLALLLTLAMVMTLTLTVSAAENETPYKDVSTTDWFYGAVKDTYDRGLFSGTSSNTFSPNTGMTRAMFVTVLANMSKDPNEKLETRHFRDVRPGAWYFDQVEWAAKYGLVSGTGDYSFSPDKNITREEMAVMLYRYAEATGNLRGDNTLVRTFSDSDKISSWAKKAIDWCLMNKIIAGRGNNKLAPRDTATRAEAAQIFSRAKDVLTNNDIVTEPKDLPEYDEIDDIIDDMSVREKVGQLFMPRYPDGNVSDMTKKYYPAGYVLYKKDFDGKDAGGVRKMTSNIQSGSEIPMFVAVDEEGGQVVRVSSNPSLRGEPYESLQKVFQRGGYDSLLHDTEDKADFLLDLGVNLNLAPVCDVSTDKNDYIYGRTLGRDAETTAHAIAMMVNTMNNKGIGSALKHFPGYGNNENTHTGISIDERPYETFENVDFLPFEAGIDADAPSILVSHNIVSCMDDKPASLSANVHAILRDELRFDGVIMTDDLSMDAIKDYTDNTSPAVDAFLAGNDLLLTSDWETDYDSVLKAVKDGTIPEGRVNESLKRILDWKSELGLI